MKLQFPMRVRCVESNSFFLRGDEHTALRMLGAEMVEIAPNYITKARRFKPVVRVQATCVHSLDLLLKRSAAAVAAMSPAEREEMARKQRLSWVRGEMALSAMGLG
jgi:hypothetical protein